jgi:hypothetical protein
MTETGCPSGALSRIVVYAYNVPNLLWIIYPLSLVVHPLCLFFRLVWVERRQLKHGQSEIEISNKVARPPAPIKPSSVNAFLAIFGFLFDTAVLLSGATFTWLLCSSFGMWFPPTIISTLACIVHFRFYILVLETHNVLPTRHGIGIQSRILLLQAALLGLHFIPRTTAALDEFIQDIERSADAIRRKSMGATAKESCILIDMLNEPLPDILPDRLLVFNFAEDD